MPKELPSPEMLRKLLRYEPETGKLFWRERSVELFEDGKYSAERVCATWNSCHAGKEALITLNAYGYKQGRVFNQMLYAHRVIWAMVHGEWPKHDIDHKDGVRDDNRISEIRAATRKENMQNLKRSSANTSGVTGVGWKKSCSKWRARITINEKQIHLGLFARKEDAIAARKAAETRYGFHPNHGRG